MSNEPPQPPHPPTEPPYPNYPVYPNQPPQMPYQPYYPAPQQPSPRRTSNNPLRPEFWHTMSTLKIAIVTAVSTVLVATVVVAFLALTLSNPPHFRHIVIPLDATMAPTRPPQPLTGATAVPGTTPPSTSSAGSPGKQSRAVSVTQNQGERQLCIADPTPYTVVLFNGATVTANWHVNVASPVTGDMPGGCSLPPVYEKTCNHALPRRAALTRLSTRLVW